MAHQLNNGHISLLSIQIYGNVCSRAIRILAAATVREWVLFLSMHLEVQFLFERGSDRANILDLDCTPSFMH